MFTMFFSQSTPVVLQSNATLKEHPILQCNPLLHAGLYTSHCRQLLSPWEQTQSHDGGCSGHHTLLEKMELAKFLTTAY